MNGVSTVSGSSIEGLVLLHRGKVRDVYEVGENRLLLVATDRISAFDCILPTPIEDKGAILTQISVFWFNKLASFVNNHLISVEIDEMPDEIRRHEELRGRSTLVKRTEVFPVECVVRGYLEGSGWKEYQADGSICGEQLPAGLLQCDKLPEPLFTPATKAATGHDENISYSQFVEIIGADAAAFLRTTSLELYRQASEYALERGIIIADTKFEFGLDTDGNILLIDEILTPDSSRFWDAGKYSPGKAQASFDKQFVREYLETLDWDKTPPAPELPREVADNTARKYSEAYEMLTGSTLNINESSKLRPT